MTRLYVYALLTALVFGSLTAEGAETIDGVMEIVSALQAEVKQLREDKRMMMDEIHRMKAEQEDNNKKMMEEIDGTKVWMNDREMDADSMFLATINEYSVSVAPGDPIIWDTAPINPGGHFNTVLGMYTAPVNGYYQFSVTKRGSDYWGAFFFLADEERYAYKYTFESHSAPGSSATINIELTAGQVVRIENYGSSLIYGSDGGYMVSWFTGFLLYAL